MPDDTAKRGKHDRIRISVEQKHEIWYWSKALHVSPEDLTAIVKKVGPMAADVKLFIINRILKAGKE